MRPTQNHTNRIEKIGSEETAAQNARTEKIRTEDARAEETVAEARGHRLTKSSRQHLSHKLKVELSHQDARPVVVVGIGLVTAIILSLIILITTTEPFGRTVQNMDLMPVIAHNPWTLTAFLLLLFCLGACLALLVLSFTRLHLKRWLRYMCAGISGAGFLAIAVLCIMALLGTALGSQYFYGMCRGMIFIRWPLLLLMGAAFGFAMPVGDDSEQNERIRRHPRRLRVLIALGGLAWTCLVFILLYAWVPARASTDRSFAALAFINASITGPLLTFFSCALAVALALLVVFPRKPRAVPATLPHPLTFCLQVVPLLVIAFFGVLALLALYANPAYTFNQVGAYGISLPHALPEMLGIGVLYTNIFGIPGLVYGVFAGAGLAFGVGIAQMKS